MLQGDQDFKLHDEIKKIIIGVIFLVGMPLLIGTYANVDILQGCIVYGPDDVGKSVPGVLSTAGVIATVTVGDKGSPPPSEGTCKTNLQGGNEKLGELLSDTQYYISVGITLVILALGFAILIGPGIKLIRH